MGLVHHPNVVTDGLKGCWDAGNRRSYPGTGTTWTDLAGGIQGTLMNEDDDALNFNSSKGGYFELDGTDGRVDCGDNLICTWSEVSICLWASATDISSGSMGMVSRGHGVVFEFSMSMDTAQKCLSCLVDGGWLLSDAGSLNSYFGKWTHYAMRWITGTDNFRLYINGEVVKTGTQSIVNIGSSGKQNLCIGDRGLVNNKEFNGDIGPVYIYDRALSDAEIKQNYEATKSRFEPRIAKSGLVGNWDAGDPNSYSGGTTTWKDTANGYAGALQNMEAADFNLSNGGYLEFDGTDEYVNIGHVGFLSEGTIELWIRYDVAPGEESNRRPWGGNDYFEARHSSAGLGGAITWDISSNSIHSVKNSWSTSVWYQQVWTWKYSSTTGSIYFDGELDVTGTIDQDPSALASSNDMYLMRSSSTYAGNVQGKLAVFRVYNRALSAAEVRDNYQAAKGRFT